MANPWVEPYRVVLRDYFRLVGQLWLERVDAELQAFAEALAQWLHDLFAAPTARANRRSTACNWPRKQ